MATHTDLFRMIRPNQAAAQAIESNATIIAASACELFLSQQPELEKQAGADLSESWETHFRQRVLELSAAVAAGQPGLFSARVDWSRQAMAARYVENVNLKGSLSSLKEVMRETLAGEQMVEALYCLDEAIKNYEHELPKPELSQLDPVNELERTALFYLQAALEGNTREAIQIVSDAISDGISPATAVTEILLAAQREVGHFWHLDQVTIAEEHLVTSTTERTLAVICNSARAKADCGRTAVTAGVSGNAHDIAIHAIAYLLELEGWRVIYLGADVPANDLPAAIHFYEADIALLSLTLSSQLGRLCETVTRVRSVCPASTKVMVGGNAFNDAPDSWLTTGADGYASSATQALELAEKLTRPNTTH
jgi:methanogenic corrinoid protein MtbC1